MSDSQSQPIDFTLMYVTHDAFRRDVNRLRAAAAAGRSSARSVLAGWENFSRQLVVHHVVEDTALWPQVEAKVQGQDDAVKLLHVMEEEHARLDPLLDSIGRSMRAGTGAASEEVEQLADVLEYHLGHEEREALPLIQRVLTPAEWSKFAAGMRRKQGVQGAAVYVPWAVDGLAADEQERFWRAMPGPLKVISRLVLEPRYRRRGLWTT